MRKNTDIFEFIEVFKKKIKFVISYLLISLVVFFSLKFIYPPKLILTYQIDIYPAISENTIREFIFNMKKTNDIKNQISNKLGKDSKIFVSDYTNYKTRISIEINYNERSELIKNSSDKEVVYDIVDKNISKILKKIFLVKINQKVKFDDEMSDEIDNFLSKKENLFLQNIVKNQIEKDVYLIKEYSSISDKINIKLLLTFIFISFFLSFVHISLVILTKRK